MPLDVLIVDDSAAIRKILHRVLVQAELPLGKVLEANDGQEALTTLQANQIGLILSDINMPNMEDRKSTRLNSSHSQQSRMPSSA